MIRYEEGRWSVCFALTLHGSVVDRAVVVAFPCALAAMLIHYLLHINPDLQETLENDVAADAHQNFTFILGFLIVFRAQTAYSRWWEAGLLLQQLRGDWFNAFSNTMAFLNQDDDLDPDMPQKVQQLQHKMARLFSLLYGNALRQVVTFEDAEFEYLNFQGFDWQSIHMLDSKRTNDSCEMVLQWIQRLIVEANTENIIKIAPPILARVYNQLGQGIVKLNSARLIRDFPVPFAFVQLIAVMLILHWVATAFFCAIMLSSMAAAGLVAFLVVFAVWGVNFMAAELENPYGSDPNDLPLQEMQEDMNRSLISLLEPRATAPPPFTYVEERDRDLFKNRELHPVTAFKEAQPLPETPLMPKPSLRRNISSHRRNSWTFHLEPVIEGPSRRHDWGTMYNAPVVDNCVQGNCRQGAANLGGATDSSYRDSALGREATEMKSEGAASPSSPSAEMLGKKEQEVDDSVSRAGSWVSLLMTGPDGAGGTPLGRGASRLTPGGRGVATGARPLNAGASGVESSSLFGDASPSVVRSASQRRASNALFTVAGGLCSSNHVPVFAALRQESRHPTLQSRGTAGDGLVAPNGSTAEDCGGQV